MNRSTLRHPMPNVLFGMLIWGGLIVGLPLASMALFGLIGAPRDQVLGSGITALMVTVFFGAPVAFAVTLTRSIFRWVSEKVRSFPTPAKASRAPLTNPITPAGGDTYNCCQDRMDVDGRIAHGGDGCNHPDAELYRDEYL